MKLPKFLNVVTMAALIFCAGIILRESNKTVLAAISQNNPLPATWIGTGGTNAFTLNATGTPVITLQGTNWTGLTTNVNLTVRNTNVVFQIIRGIIVGVPTSP